MLNIPYVSAADVNRWQQVLTADYPKIESAVKAGDTQKGRRIYLLFRDNINWAALAYAQGWTEVRNHLETALGYFHMLKSEVERGRADPKYVTEAIDDALCVALILKDQSALTDIAQLYPSVYIDKTDRRYLYGSSVLELLRNNLSSDGAGQASPSRVELGAGLPAAVHALARGDDSEFARALSLAIDEYDEYIRAEARGTPEAALFLQGAALLSLFELRRGVKLDQQPADVRFLRLDS